MLLKSEAIEEGIAGEKAIYVLKKTYDGVFPQYPFNDTVTRRCIADTLIAISLESTVDIQEKLGATLSLALIHTPCMIVEGNPLPNRH
ncbi:hypothetical protein [Alteromonas sp. 14N.309.X.WAT.G.H12]|uniref:hypothetical protein n=1 Tax=Alteromonas sp. 14N.309.X.WAT.G.H12 TaxID=3120824 RepID=UPI002FD6935D